MASKKDLQHLTRGQRAKRTVIWVLKRTLTFLVSHVGLTSLVVGYVIFGGVVFMAIERQYELEQRRAAVQLGFNASAGITDVIARYLASVAREKNSFSSLPSPVPGESTHAGKSTHGGFPTSETSLNTSTGYTPSTAPVVAPMITTATQNSFGDVITDDVITSGYSWLGAEPVQKSRRIVAAVPQYPPPAMINETSFSSRNERIKNSVAAASANPRLSGDVIKSYLEARRSSQAAQWVPPRTVTKLVHPRKTGLPVRNKPARDIPESYTATARPTKSRKETELSELYVFRREKRQASGAAAKLVAYSVSGSVTASTESRQRVGWSSAAATPATKLAARGSPDHGKPTRAKQNWNQTGIGTAERSKKDSKPQPHRHLPLISGHGDSESRQLELAPPLQLQPQHQQRQQQEQPTLLLGNETDTEWLEQKVSRQSEPPRPGQLALQDVQQTTELMLQDVLTGGQLQELKSRVLEKILEFEQSTVRLIRDRHWDGHVEMEKDVQWSFPGAMLYSVTVVTTIGYGTPAPKTLLGRLVTMAYAVVGIPLTFMCVRNMGGLLSTIVTAIYRHAIVGLAMRWKLTKARMARSKRINLIRDIMNDGARRLSANISRQWVAMDHRLLRDQELRRSLRRIHKERRRWRRRYKSLNPEEEEDVEEDEQEEEEEEENGVDEEDREDDVDEEEGELGQEAEGIDAPSGAGKGDQPQDVAEKRQESEMKEDGRRKRAGSDCWLQGRKERGPRQSDARTLQVNLKGVSTEPMIRQRSPAPENTRADTSASDNEENRKSDATALVGGEPEVRWNDPKRKPARKKKKKTKGGRDQSRHHPGSKSEAAACDKGQVEVKGIQGGKGGGGEKYVGSDAEDEFYDAPDDVSQEEESEEQKNVERGRPRDSKKKEGKNGKKGSKTTFYRKNNCQNKDRLETTDNPDWSDKEDRQDAASSSKSGERNQSYSRKRTQDKDVKENCSEDSTFPDSHKERLRNTGKEIGYAKPNQKCSETNKEVQKCKKTETNKDNKKKLNKTWGSKNSKEQSVIKDRASSVDKERKLCVMITRSSSDTSRQRDEIDRKRTVSKDRNSGREKSKSETGSNKHRQSLIQAGARRISRRAYSESQASSEDVDCEKEEGSKCLRRPSILSRSASSRSWIRSKSQERLSSSEHNEDVDLEPLTEKGRRTCSNSRTFRTTGREGKRDKAAPRSSKSPSKLSRSRSTSSTRKSKKERKEELRRFTLLQEQERVRKLLLQQTRARRAANSNADNAAAASASFGDNDHGHVETDKSSINNTSNAHNNASGLQPEPTRTNMANVTVIVDDDSQDDDEDDDIDNDVPNIFVRAGSRMGPRYPQTAADNLDDVFIAAPPSVPSSKLSFRKSLKRSFKRSFKNNRSGFLEEDLRRPMQREAECLPSSTRQETRRGNLAVLLGKDALLGADLLLKNPASLGVAAAAAPVVVVEDEGEEYDPLAKTVDTSHVRVPVWVTLLIMNCYIVGGAVMFTVWEEDWTFLDGYYFCFITLTTIGFGDLVPGTSIDSLGEAQEKWIMCCVYLLLGMALQAMSFHLMQEEVVEKVKWLATRMGLLSADDVTVVGDVDGQEESTAVQEGKKLAER